MILPTSSIMRISGRDITGMESLMDLLTSNCLDRADVLEKLNTQIQTFRDTILALSNPLREMRLVA
jgi:hypothetical protein